MKKIFIIICGIVTATSNSSSAGNTINSPGTTLSGRITDKSTGESLPGAVIYITDLKTGSAADSAGNYSIDNLPQSIVLVQVSLLGYKLIAERIDLSTTLTKNFAMETSIAELNEIVVTGLSQASERNRTPTPISTITPLKLLQGSSTNLIDAIAAQPGISQVTTGTGISKPVIRGLGYNRVVVVNDGIRQEGQQWGDEHGIEMDEFAINKVEILKGPASLSYGSDAMAGVINMLSAPTLPEGKITGNILTNYQTNNGQFGNSANLAGNIKGYIWDVRYSNKMAHAYQNKYDGYVLNSGYKENTVGGITGFNGSWGYSHLHFSSYNLTTGIVEGDRDSASGNFVKPIALNDSTEEAAIATADDFNSYSPLTPYQKIHHYKAVLNNNFIIGNGNLNAILGWQQNQRQEYGNILYPNDYGLYFLLNTINYDIRYQLPEKNNLNLSFGLNGMQQSSQNKGSEFLIPEYNLFDIGIFAIFKKSIDKLDVSGGLRYDSRNEKGKDLFLNSKGEKVASNYANAFKQFTAFNSTFSGISGSIGATYQFSEKVFTKLNLSRGFRAPNIAEIGANGVHEGTGRYEIGDAGLAAENSLQCDYSIGLNSMHVSAEANLFYNYISNFIYSGRLSNAAGGDSIIDNTPVYKFMSGDADLYGGEFIIDIHPHPLDWLHFENTFSFVQSMQRNQPDSTKYLPFTPAPKFTTELKATSKKPGKNLANAYVQAGMDFYFRQDKFYAANKTETATPQYALLNFGVGADIVSKSKTLFSIYISANNLADIAYQSHLSRLKYEAVNMATGRTGVYNMGRNISFKVLIPIRIK